MRFLFAVAVFTNAALLFAVQPMVARMVLPLLGGTPAVWNTCMVFFQVALLAGYACAHLLATRLSVRQQAGLYPLIQLVVLLLLPISIGDGLVQAIPTEVNPVPWLLGVLSITVGFPVFVVAMTGPLLQTWFAKTELPGAREPYTLYAASNLGSLLALLSYPVLIESNYPLGSQAWIWLAGYGVLVALTLACAFTMWRRPMPVIPASQATEAAPERITMGRRLRWVLLAMAPSSLMLGVTTYLSTDIGSFPLLWVVPLGLYLLTFVIVFARRPIVPRAWVVRAVPIVVTILSILLLSDSMQPPVAWWIAIHLLTFFVLALFCHGELASDRPAAAHLTDFYLCLAVGGVLGGAFNALAAPMIFTQVWEYPLALVLVCLLRQPAPPKLTLDGRPATKESQRLRLWDWVLPISIGVLVVALTSVVRAGKLEYNPLTVGLLFGLPSVLCYTFVDRPVRFALGILAVQIAAAIFPPNPDSQPVYSERSFFGLIRVTRDRDALFYQLVLGGRSRSPITIVLVPWEISLRPLSRASPRGRSA
jgi:hypothetical protein